MEVSMSREEGKREFSASNKVKDRRLPPWLTGSFAGGVFWCLAVAAHPTLRFLELRHDFFASWLPAWLMRMGWFGLDIDYLQEYVERASSPISGEWLEADMWIGLCLYALTGASLFSLFSMIRKRRFSLRTLMLVTTLVALLLGFGMLALK
jgi:hypothetical protein